MPFGDVLTQRQGPSGAVIMGTAVHEPSMVGSICDLQGWTEVTANTSGSFEAYFLL